MPVPDLAGLPAVDVRVESCQERVVERELDVEKAGDLGEEGEQTVLVDLKIEMVKLDTSMVPYMVTVLDGGNLQLTWI